MGINFRKSFNFGKGFKINLSKSGIGYSFNTFGGRVTRTASGKINYKYTGFKSDKKSSSKDNPDEGTLNDIENAEIENFQSAEYRDIIDRITKSLWINRISNIFVIVAVLSIANPYFLISLLVGLVLKILLVTVLDVDLEYKLDEELANEYNIKVQAWKKLNECDKLWQVLSESKTVNKKAMAGINRNVVRKRCKINMRTPFYLSVNVDVIQIKLKNEKLIFLPDKVLIVKGCKVGAISHSSVKIVASKTEFVENRKASNDAMIIDYRYQYSNKNGEADKRYKNNKKIPVYSYGVIYITSNEGLNVELHCSNVTIIDKFKQVAYIE